MGALNSSKYFPDPRDAAFVEKIQQGDVARVSAAIKAGQNVNVMGVKGFQPIHFVFAASNAGVATVLLDAGADPNARLANSNTPLHYAVQQKTADFTAVFLQHRADPNAEGESHKPVLFAALDSPISEQVLPMLASAGADINFVWGGYSPVQSAMVGLTWKAANVLLSLGADPMVRNRRGETAGDIFCSMLRRLQPTPTNHAAVWAVGSGLKAKGVVLPCDDKLSQFE